LHDATALPVAPGLNAHDRSRSRVSSAYKVGNIMRHFNRCERDRQRTSSVRRTLLAQVSRAHTRRRSGVADYAALDTAGCPDTSAACHYSSSHQLVENRFLGGRDAPCEDPLLPLRRSSISRSLNSPPVSLLGLRQSPASNCSTVFAKVNLPCIAYVSKTKLRLRSGMQSCCINHLLCTRAPISRLP
jgi:hypothetical protein